MKLFINILFVYIPYGIAVFLQVLFLLALYSDETGVASLAKWCFPFIALTGIVLHFITRKKNDSN
jgi:hypothetical protein